MSAWTWLAAVIWCPVAAVVGGIVVAVQTQDLVVGVIAGIAGLAVSFVVAAVLGVIVEVLEELPMPKVFSSSTRPGQGLIKARKYRVLDTIMMVPFTIFFLPIILVAFLGAPVATIVATIVVGSQLGG